MNIEIEVKNLTSKDEKSALKAAGLMLDSGSADMFNTLVKRSEFLFDFVKQNVNKRLAAVLTKSNYKDLLLSFYKKY